MKNKLLALTLTSFLLGCTYLETPLKKIEKYTNYQYVSSATLDFYYDDIKGFDNSGPLYAVLEFKKDEDKFLDQFYNKKEDINHLQKGRNERFEELVDNFINTFFYIAYEGFEEQYKLDWSRPYSYYLSSNEAFSSGLVYYHDLRTVTIIHLKS